MKKVFAWLNIQPNDITIFSVIAMFIALAAIFFGSW